MVERENLKIEKKNETQKKEIELFLVYTSNIKKYENEGLKLKINRLNNRVDDLQNSIRKNDKKKEVQQIKIDEQLKI